MTRFRLFAAVSLTLSACSGDSKPPTQVTPTPTPTDTTLIGAAGGTVTAADGAATLVIPSGALSTPTRVTLSRRTAPALDAALVTGMYVVEPVTVVFAQSATLNIKYSAGGLPGGAVASEVRVGALAGTTFTPSANGTNNANTLTASLPLTSAGSFAVLWSPTTCAEPERRQFDFWIGHWRFDATGQPAGDETVTAIGNNCGLRETFVQGTYRGSSVSLWSPTQQKWFQTYVDTDNARRILSGTLIAGGMILNETGVLRYGWRPTSSTVVRFFEERSSDNGATWRETFTSTYTKIP